MKDFSCVINLKNNDQKCFKYAVQAGLYELLSPFNLCRISSYTYTETLKDAQHFDMISMHFYIHFKYLHTFSIFIHFHELSQSHGYNSETLSHSQVAQMCHINHYLAGNESQLINDYYYRRHFDRCNYPTWLELYKNVSEEHLDFIVSRQVLRK